MLRRLILSFLLTASALTAQSQVRYQAVDLGVPGFAGILVEGGVHDAFVSHVWATGINDQGIVVGGYIIDYYYTNAGQRIHNTVRRGFRWENGQFTDLGALYGGQYTGNTYASDINEQGRIVGSTALGPMDPQPYYHYDPEHAFSGNGSLTDLGTATEVYHSSSAAALNNNGVVVGTSDPYAVKWESGVLTRLPALLPTHKAMAHGINDAGLIVGQSIDVIAQRVKAVLWRPGQAAEDLDPTPLNLQESEAVDLNEQGRIVGAVRPGTDWLPVRWDNGQMSYLFRTPAGGARPAAVNNLGHVVGAMRSTTAARSTAFLWTDALYNPAMMAPYYDLETMIPPNTGWELWGATDINERGYIVGSGRRNGANRAFLLIPEDDPTADIDADSNRDGVIDANDDGIERSMPGAIVAPNADDSNGDGILDSDNEAIDGPADRAQLTRLVVRRPSTVAPTLVGEARLRLLAGPGRIRVFLDDGAAGQVVLGPTQAQGADFWAQLAAGDLTLLAEGVVKGDLLLELELIVNGNRHTDVIALHVPDFVLELHADEPFLDADGDPFASGFLEVPADFQALDYQGVEGGGVLNLYARFYREDELDANKVPPERDVKWKIEPLGANQATQPGLRDLLQAQTDFQPEITAPARAHVSRTQMRFSFPHPAQIDPATGQPRPWVKAGDTFRITASVDLPGGRTLRQERAVRIVPGKKYFHITEPPAGVQPDALWRLTDSQFEQQFAATHFEAPLSSGESKTLTALLLDAYRNPLAAGIAVPLRLEGSGYLGALDTSVDAPDTETSAEVAVGAGGQVQIRMTQTTFASCPWQPEPELQDGAGVIGLFASRVDPLARSMVTRDERFPVALGDVAVEKILPTTVTPGYDTPDIYRKDTRDFEVRVYRTSSAGPIALAGVEVKFSSLNGKMLRGQDARTGADGIARATLTHVDARADEEIVVIAAVGVHSTVVSRPGMRWISSAPTVVKPQHRILAGDKTADGIVYVETLDDTGEALAFPGAVEGDFRLGVPYRTRSRVDVTGIPNHVYKVDIVDNVSWLPSARYPFDLASGQTTPDVIGARDAAYGNTALDLVERKEGTGAFIFSLGALVTVPGSPAVDLANGLLIELWANPREHRGKLLERSGQYRIDLIDSGPQRGHVRFRIEGADAKGQPVNYELVSARPLPLDQWSLVEARYDGTSLRLGVGPDRDELDMAFRSFPAVQPAPLGTPVRVGDGYAGRLDDLRFTTGGHGRKVAVATGLSADGTLATDQNGRGYFFVESTGQWDPDRYQPALLMVELSGSQKAVAGVQVTHSNIIGQMVNAGKAFLLGTESLGKDAQWFERASAWVSENLPLLSDLRTLAMELYKAGSGCDKVSMMNVTFAAVGVIADVATFGSAGAGVRGMAATLKVVTKAFLKEFATNTVMAALSQAAISAYVRELTIQTAAAANGSPPGWVLRGNQFMTSMTAWAQQGLSSVLDNSLASLHDMLSWNLIYAEMGEQAARRMLEGVQTLGAELEAGTP